MRHLLLSIVVAITTMALAVRRTDAEQSAARAPAPAAGAPSADSGSGSTPGVGTSTTGTVVETMDAGAYTYVQIDDGAKKIWAAAPKFSVAVGDRVIVPEGMPMRDFESKTLGRTFELVYFVSGIQVLGARNAKEQLAAAHGAAGHGAAGHGAAGDGATGHAAVTKPVAVDLSNIPKAEGGHTVAELFADKAALSGKEVVVRGRVVKFTGAVMGKNWIHVRDGTGGTGANDMTVSTSATATVGNTVLVRGKLSTDRDLGFGYHYDAIIEDAAVAVE